MTFKYKAPLHYPDTSIEYAGQIYLIDTRNMIETDQDIHPILQPHGFTRVHDDVVTEPKKATTTK